MSECMDELKHKIMDLLSFRGLTEQQLCLHIDGDLSGLEFVRDALAEFVFSGELGWVPVDFPSSDGSVLCKLYYRTYYSYVNVSDNVVKDLLRSLVGSVAMCLDDIVEALKKKNVIYFIDSNYVNKMLNSLVDDGFFQRLTACVRGREMLLWRRYGLGERAIEWHSGDGEPPSVESGVWCGLVITTDSSEACPAQYSKDMGWSLMGDSSSVDGYVRWWADFPINQEG